MGDLIADLMHYCRDTGLDWEYLEAHAAMHVAIERCPQCDTAHDVDAGILEPELCASCQARIDRHRDQEESEDAMIAEGFAF